VIAPERTNAIRLATARLCGQLGWVRVHEMGLPNGRRADIMALRPDDHFVCIEVKSGLRDFLADHKWETYRDYADALYFAVDIDFPSDMLPNDIGLIVVADGIAELIHEAPSHPITPARRRALLRRFAILAAARLAALEDPAGAAALFAALRVE
jgi:hypothetical protein